MRTTFNSPLVWFIALFFFTSSPAAAGDNWVIHEWGTFTSYQAEDGRLIGGINNSEEALPSFTHSIAPSLVGSGQAKGAPKNHPDVTMRLETPVMYFHPPDGFSGSALADVTVRFHGGWLTQFYPQAQSNATGLKEGETSFGPLRRDTVSSLIWRKLRIGGLQLGPDTNEPAWTAPRQVNAESVTAENGETERFLFYRGVACLEPPIRIAIDSEADLLQVYSRLEPGIRLTLPARLPAFWLVDVCDDGLAFRATASLRFRSDSRVTLARMPASFSPASMHHDNASRLRESMRVSLVKEGLFSDEADALLNTWDSSYFKSPGLRVFFIVPKEWVDYYLPLTVTLPNETSRVMVGRIELVTPHDRACEESRGVAECATRQSGSNRKAQLMNKLGRFASALIADEEQRQAAATATPDASRQP